MASPQREGKKKEIYKYVAPWTVFAMNWSMRLDKRWRLAIGSFIEDYTNKVPGTPLTLPRPVVACGDLRVGCRSLRRLERDVMNSNIL